MNFLFQVALHLHLWQGVYGGVLLCSIFATTGAYLMHWPLWWFTGPFYGPQPPQDRNRALGIGLP